MTAFGLGRALLVGLVLTVLALPVPNRRRGEMPGQQLQEQVGGHEVLTVIRIPPDFNPPDRILEDSTGIVWLGSTFGLYAYDETRGGFEDRSWAFGKTPSVWPVGALAEDARREIWAGYGLAGEVAFYTKRAWHHADAICPPGVESLGHALVPGRDGRVWFVSSAGLLGYDGARWEGPFNPTQAALDGYRSLLAAGRTNSRPSQSDSVRSHNLAPDETAKWISGFWNGIEDGDGEVWLSGERAIWRFNRKTGGWKAYTAIYHQNEGQSIVLVDSSGGIWFWDRRGHFSRYDKQADRWAAHDISERLTGPVNCLWPDRPGRVIIGTNGGNFILNENSGELTPLIFQGVPMGPTSRMEISAAELDRRGRIWVACGDRILILRQ